MKILILEDNEARIEWFKKTFGGFELLIAKNVSDAIRNFEWFAPFDFIFLDHDLDGLVYVDSDEKNTGFQFAKYLASKEVDNRRIILHTMNTVGAKRMLGVLPRASYIPFSEMLQKNMRRYIRTTIENNMKEY